MKIIALLPVKNEAWVLRHCLQSLSFCDEILAIDDNSTDNTRAILNKFRCTVLSLDTATDIGWSEYKIRSFLLSEARKRQATHIIAIDGDEMFSDAFVKDARSLLEKLPLGSNLALPWVDVLSDTTAVKPIIQKVFATHDDGSTEFKTGFIHIPRVPDQSHVTNLSLPYSVIHFQFLHHKKRELKRVWYMMSEFEKGTRSAFRINITYYPKSIRTTPFIYQQSTSQTLPDPANDKDLWQLCRIQERFDLRGYNFFEKLDIWNLPETRIPFETKTGKSVPHVRPSVLFIILNELKNIITRHFYILIAKHLTH